ncbi:S8 family serine peptidase, partial [Candidatus Puniceispirillum sp.]|nr:S8 family serine peptidase [Candidatus Puniceispirillum sp.]
MAVNGVYRLSSDDTDSNYYTHPTKIYNVETLLLTDDEVSLGQQDLSNFQIDDEYSNSINGSEDDDIFDGGGGSDIIDGKLGHDTAIFFTSINDALIEIDHTNNSASVSYAAVNQEEYAFSKTTLYSVEKIKFIDGEQDILTSELFDASISTTQILEGTDQAILQLQLQAQPSSDVEVNVSSGDLIIDNSQVFFTPSNWDEPQIITITAQDNDTYGGDQDHSISFDLRSDDINFNFDIPNKFTVTVKDDEIPEVNDTIEGRIWEDWDRDGQLDINEQGLSNLAVFIDSNNNHSFDQGETSVVTNSSGFYQFSNLEIGTYSVGLIDDYGWQYTFPSMSAAGAVATTLTGAAENYEVASTSYFQDVSNSKTSLRADLNASYSDLDGTGQTVVVIDTGIDTDHSYFGDRIIYSKTFGNGLANGEDVEGHGTHVAGIIASSDEQFTGVAPKANIIALKVLGDTDGDDLIQSALQWCVANAEKYSIDAVNLSLEFPGYFFQNEESYYLKDGDLMGLGDEFSALTELGVVCVAASGNGYGGLWDYYVFDGTNKNDFQFIPAGTHSIQGISSPAAYSEVIAVGATWGGPDLHPWGSFNANEGAPNAGSIVHFSQRDDELLDVVAYGGGITSAAMGGESIALSGTSMASPYVTGLVLLMQQAAEQELGRKLSVDEVKTIINTYSEQNFDGDDENYSTQLPSNVSYNEASINNWLDVIIELKNPQFHTVDLNQEPADHNFGLVSSKANAFTNQDEQVVVTTAGAETFSAGGNDYLIGSSGEDILYGGDGDDLIEAGAGDDKVYGGKGDDLLSGGDGVDVFSYTLGDGNDVIIDFDQENEIIEYVGYTNQQQSQFVQSTLENG